MNLSSSTENATTAANATGVTGGQMYTEVIKVVSVSIMCLSFLLGVPGNLLVIWIIWRHVKPRSHTILLILHLAAADLLFVITLPLGIHSRLHSWVFGEALCKATTYMQYVSMYGSIFLITLMSVERFVAVCYPFAMLSSRTKSILDACLMALWVPALALALPVVLNNHVADQGWGEQCYFYWYSSFTQEVVFLSLETIAGFVVPVSILSVCSCLVVGQLRAKNFQGKKQVMVLITSVVVVFILCWLPYHIVNIFFVACLIRGTSENELCVSESAESISWALMFMGSSVNPVLYAFAARKSAVRIGGLRMVQMFQDVAAHSRAQWGSNSKESDSACDIKSEDGRETVV